MKITPAFKLQSYFQSGLQITGDNERGQLEWLGTMTQRVLADMRIQDFLDLKKAEAKEREYSNIR